ncbi:unnamed protein product [Hydatigera taeniaeformis]|uniref:Uncharacterized protein n=1 Tax=Hydatigena taeniaeformis TaxID=6205 RepID=A0A0R3WSX1_HYDTA|nr:unnamed protein product [Hydatigera taeniaeformis]
MIIFVASDSLLQENQEGHPNSSKKEENGRCEEDDVETNDTFTSHRRQRAKFLKLFLERASHHRYQQRGTQQASRLLVGSTGPLEEAHDPPFADNVVTASESALHHHPLSLTPAAASKAPIANTTAVAACRRNSSAAQKRAAAQAVRTKLVSLRKKNPSMDSVVGTLLFFCISCPIRFQKLTTVLTVNTIYMSCFNLGSITS